MAAKGSTAIFQIRESTERVKALFRNWNDRSFTEIQTITASFANLVKNLLVDRQKYEPGYPLNEVSSATDVAKMINDLFSLPSLSSYHKYDEILLPWYRYCVDQTKKYSEDDKRAEPWYAAIEAIITLRFDFEAPAKLALLRREDTSLPEPR